MCVLLLIGWMPVALQTIKQLQQRLAELKRTLQKELVRHLDNLVWVSYLNKKIKDSVH